MHLLAGSPSAIESSPPNGVDFGIVPTGVCDGSSCPNPLGNDPNDGQRALISDSATFVLNYDGSVAKLVGIQPRDEDNFLFGTDGNVSFAERKAHSTAPRHPAGAFLVSRRAARSMFPAGWPGSHATRCPPPGRGARLRPDVSGPLHRQGRPQLGQGQPARRHLFSLVNPDTCDGAGDNGQGSLGNATSDGRAWIRNEAKIDLAYSSDSLLGDIEKTEPIHAQA
jgi:hypothetical protein